MWWIISGGSKKLGRRKSRRFSKLLVRQRLDGTVKDDAKNRSGTAVYGSSITALNFDPLFSLFFCYFPFKIFDTIVCPSRISLLSKEYYTELIFVLHS